MMATPMLTAKDVRHRLTLSKWQFTQLIRRGAFPNAISLGDPENPRKSGWRIPESDVQHFLDSRRVVASLA